MPDDYERGITASALYNYPRLSENVSHGLPLTGVNFLAALSGMGARDAGLSSSLSGWANDRDPGSLARRGPLNAIDWMENRWPAPNYAEPEPATSSLTIADQMRSAPFLEQLSRLIDAPSTRTPSPLWRQTQTPGRY